MKTKDTLPVKPTKGQQTITSTRNATHTGFLLPGIHSDGGWQPAGGGGAGGEAGGGVTQHEASPVYSSVIA